MIPATPDRVRSIASSSAYRWAYLSGLTSQAPSGAPTDGSHGAAVRAPRALFHVEQALGYRPRRQSSVLRQAAAPAVPEGDCARALVRHRTTTPTNLCSLRRRGPMHMTREGRLGRQSRCARALSRCFLPDGVHLPRSARLGAPRRLSGTSRLRELLSRRKLRIRAWREWPCGSTHRHQTAEMSLDPPTPSSWPPLSGVR